MKFKHFILLLILASFSAIIYGFVIKKNNEPLGHKYIGGGTVGLFLIAMPLFLIKESRGKKMKDYMLSKENIKTMQERENQKKKSY